MSFLFKIFRFRTMQLSVLTRPPSTSLLRSGTLLGGLRVCFGFWGICQFPPAALARVLVTAAAALGTCVGGGCAGPDLMPAEQVVSPYSITTGEVLLAVAPLRNESGTGVVDTLAMTDRLVQKLDEITGITCLPTNRSLQAMRALGMEFVSSPSDAKKLGRALGVDGLVVGTITAYDPYDPPKLGLTLAIFGSDGRLAGNKGGGPDPVAMQSAGSEAAVSAGLFRDQPLTVVSEMLDGRDQGVQMNVRRYAEGRTEQATALGWRGFMVNMDLYSQFASWWSVYRLMSEERLRVSRTADAERRNK